MPTIMLDTNAAIDLVQARIPKRHGAMERIVSFCSSDDDAICIPSLSIKDISYYFENNRTIKEIVPTESERRTIASSVRDTLFHECRVFAVDEAIARAAHANEDEPDYDDALVAECAKAAGADVIISSDREAFQHSTIPKASPEEYAEYLEIQAKFERR